MAEEPERSDALFQVGLVTDLPVVRGQPGVLDLHGNLVPVRPSEHDVRPASTRSRGLLGHGRHLAAVPVPHPARDQGLGLLVEQALLGVTTGSRHVSEAVALVRPGDGRQPSGRALGHEALQVLLRPDPDLAGRPVL